MVHVGHGEYLAKQPSMRGKLQAACARLPSVCVYLGPCMAQMKKCVPRVVKDNQRYLLVAAWVARSKAATVCEFWIMHSCLIITHCLFYNTLLQTGLSFMCPIIVQPMQTFILTLQENIFDVHHLVDFHSECLTVDNNYVCCKCIP